MEVYEATAYDKCDKNRSYETYIAMTDGAIDTDERDARLAPFGLSDDDIHYYFYWEDDLGNRGYIDTDEFFYLIGKEIIKDGED